MTAQSSVQVYDIDPIPKPRMTRSDKWNERPAVMRYRAFKDECRYKRVTLPDCFAHVIFYVSMPRSWSEKKKADFEGMPHQQRPDVDNFLKSLLDAVFSEDSQVWDIRVSKLWARKGRIEIII